MEPPRILPLPEQVVNKIAAGEVIQRPFSAVKELIENSVDAGATQVTVTMKGAGAMIQVQDNGQGIHPDDLNIICRRFNTSKLRKFEDLKSMTTYGFRGEALASMTHVARVTITSQKPNQPCSYRATYKDGGIVGKPSKCAGVPGTTITVEDLFYNVPQRLRALKSAGEEYGKVLEVVQKYAVHYSSKAGFTCKRAGVHSPDVHTTATATLKENIAKIFGSEVARELVELTCATPPVPKGETVPVFQSLKGIVTNPNYSRKKGEFLLFINGRLVDSAALKRVVDSCYAECLPKGGHPFVYLSLELPLENVDVNVHPTKKEVQFLHEEEICASLLSALRSVLFGGNESRTFQTAKLQPRILEQTVVDADETLGSQESLGRTPKRLKTDEEADVVVDDDDDDEEEDAGNAINDWSDSGKKKKKTPRPDKLVRTDAQMGSGMERFLVSSQKDVNGKALIHLEEEETNGAESCGCTDTCAHGKGPLPRQPTGASPAGYIIRDDVDNAGLIVAGSDALELESVKNLLGEFEAKKNTVLTECLKRSVFVGVVDARFSLIQYDTSLVAVDHVKLAREMFYQRVLTLFGRFRMVKLNPQPVLNELFEGDKSMATSLEQHAELLYEYFGIDVRKGKLSALPRLLAGHLPQPRAIPNLLRSLARDVDWADERSCFRSVARQVAKAYAELPEFRPLITSSTAPSMPPVSLGDKTSIQYLVKNVLFGGFRSSLLASQEMADARNGIVVPLTKLEQLYKIFERC